VGAWERRAGGEEMKRRREEEREWRVSWGSSTVRLGEQEQLS